MWLNSSTAKRLKSGGAAVGEAATERLMKRASKRLRSPFLRTCLFRFGVASLDLSAALFFACGYCLLMLLFSVRRFGFVENKSKKTWKLAHFGKSRLMRMPLVMVIICLSLEMASMLMSMKLLKFSSHRCWWIVSISATAIDFCSFSKRQCRYVLKTMSGRVSLASSRIEVIFCFTSSTKLKAGLEVLLFFSSMRLITYR